MDDQSAYTIEELSRLADLPIRTIRYYIAEGLVPRAGARGRSAGYGAEHLLRLRLIRLLVEQRVPLASIRERMAGLSLNDLRQLLAEEERQSRQIERSTERASPREYVSMLLERARQSRVPPVTPAASEAEPRLSAARPSAPAPSASGRTLPADRAALDTWRRVGLAPGVELHIRQDAESTRRSLIERVLRAARSADDSAHSETRPSREEGSNSHDEHP